MNTEKPQEAASPQLTGLASVVARHSFTSEQKRNLPMFVKKTTHITVKLNNLYAPQVQM